MQWKPLVTAAAVAVAGIVLLLQYKTRFEEEATGGAKVPVLVARKDVPLGELLTDDLVGVHEIPSAYVEDRHIRASDLQRVLGVRVSMGLRANESILWSDLATASGQRRDLSSLVQPNMRAVTIRAGHTSTFGGLLRPGDRVDVLLTAERENGTSVTLPLIQNVLVLAVGRDTGGEQAATKQRGGGSQNQVTLSATPEQGTLLAHSERVGTLSLALRNPDDISVQQNVPQTTMDHILVPERLQQAQRREPANAQPTVTLPEPIR